LEVRRGDIVYANLNPVIGSEQGGTRPVLVLQNDIGNRHSPTTIVAAITSRIKKAKLPTHVEICADDYGLERDSVILLEQLRTIDKRRLKEKLAHLDEESMNRVNKGLMISLGLMQL
jgi:mRNA interferase MazF